LQARITAAAVLLAVVAAGCRGPGRGELTGRAADEWTRTYTLTPGGEVLIENSSGAVDVQATSGSTVEVRAERTAKGLTDAMARELLPKISIAEDIAPGRVSIRTGGIEGLLIGAAIEVSYHVRAPATASLRVRATNGGVHVDGFRSRVVLASRNGSISGEGLEGGVEARTTNGDTRIALSSLAADLIELRSTNGQLQLTLPPAANANLLANLTNGRFEINGLKFEPMGEQSRRRVRGRINEGGTPIELTTTNGNIQVGTAAVQPAGPGR
jgi:DUF4097 and DUF4098 domain-containing protein YvlB